MALYARKTTAPPKEPTSLFWVAVLTPPDELGNQDVDSFRAATLEDITEELVSYLAHRMIVRDASSSVTVARLREALIDVFVGGQ